MIASKFVHSLGEMVKLMSNTDINKGIAGVLATRDNKSYKLLADIATREHFGGKMNMYRWHVNYAVIVFKYPSSLKMKENKLTVEDANPEILRTNARLLYQTWLSNQLDNGTVDAKFFQKMCDLIKENTKTHMESEEEVVKYLRIIEDEDIVTKLYKLADDAWDYKKSYKSKGPRGALDLVPSIRI